MPDLLLDVRRLEKPFKTLVGIVHEVNGVSFGLKERESLGVEGDSGYGTSVTMPSVLGLIPEHHGKVIVGETLFCDTGGCHGRSQEIQFCFLT
jgi:ABC-type dipeptide/oligopeptide/nickel transport system ATPase component